MSQDKTPHEIAEAKDRTDPQEKAAIREPKGRTKWIVALILVLFCIAGYFVYLEYFAGRESTDDAQIDGHINPIAAKVSGHVLAIKIEDNQFVKAGTILVQIDPKDYVVALEKARADLAAAKTLSEAAHTQVPVTVTTTSSQSNLAGAGIERAESARAAAMKDVESARARLESALARVRENQAIYTKAAQDLERMKLLIAKDEISKQQYDAAVASATAAQAAKDSAQAGVDENSKAIEAAQARVGQEDAKIKEAQANLQATRTGPQQQAISRSNAMTAIARVKQAQAALDQAELNMQYTEVRAPIDGIVSERKVELGQYVQVGQPLLALVPLHNVWVTANYKENQLKDMQPGQKAVISVDAYGGRKYKGHVDSLSAATGARFSLLPPENATGNYVKVVQRVPVKIIIDEETDDAHPLRPGLSVISTVYTGGK
ncbi:MAG TPA: HlyD family secretion protein [Acidobacteriota bacterium]|nr:HlyD family secretion protein [Acidobacteriota bacterium]